MEEKKEHNHYHQGGDKGEGHSGEDSQTQGDEPQSPPPPPPPPGGGATHDPEDD